MQNININIVRYKTFYTVQLFNMLMMHDNSWLLKSRAIYHQCIFFSATLRLAHLPVCWSILELPAQISSHDRGSLSLSRNTRKTLLIIVATPNLLWALCRVSSALCCSPSLFWNDTKRLRRSPAGNVFSFQFQMITRRCRFILRLMTTIQAWRAIIVCDYFREMSRSEIITHTFWWF